MIFKSYKGAALLALLLVGAVVAWLLVFSHKRVSAGLYFFSVGQGDSQLIVFPNKAKMLIDGGVSGELLLKNITQVIPDSDRYIDVIVMTHPQSDHFEGFIKLLERYSIGVFVSSGRAADTSLAYKELIEVLKRKKIPYVRLVEGDRLTLGESEVLVLGPSESEWKSKDLNDSSVVLKVQIGGVRALYTGDIGFAVEKRLAQTYDLRVDVLKVAHHGSRFSSDATFLNEVRPVVSVIGVGKNSYGHPTAQTLNRLASAGDIVLRTDRDGLIHLFRNLEGVLEISHIKKLPQ